MVLNSKAENVSTTQTNYFRSTQQSDDDLQSNQQKHKP